MYGQKWVDYIELAGGSESAMKVWQQGLEGITSEEIRRGVGACLFSGKPWPPTLPEFRDLCRSHRDAEFEFERAAFILWCQPIDWGGDAVLYATVRSVGAFDVRTRPYAGTTKARWEKALRVAEANAAALDAPPAPPSALITEKPTDSAKARSILSALKEKLFGDIHE